MRRGRGERERLTVLYLLQIRLSGQAVVPALASDLLATKHHNVSSGRAIRMEPPPSGKAIHGPGNKSAYQADYVTATTITRTTLPSRATLKAIDYISAS